MEEATTTTAAAAEGKKPGTFVTFVNSKGEKVECDIAPATIERKAKVREIERIAGVRAEEFNARNLAIRAKQRAEIDARNAGELDKAEAMKAEIEAELKLLQKMDTDSFDRTIEQVQQMVIVPKGQKIDWKQQDTNEFDTALFFFFGGAQRTTLL